MCLPWNSISHVQEYEGAPERRPFTYDELQQFFDYADSRVDAVARSGRKGPWRRYETRRCSRRHTPLGFDVPSSVD